MTMPGTRWVSRKGVHAGNEVEIVKLTGGDRVVVRRVGGEGASWSKAKSEAAGVQTLGRDVFLANYTPRDALVANGRGTSKAFRQNNRNGKVPVEEVHTNGSIAIATPIQAVTPKPPRDRVNGSGLHIEVLTITPDQARAWLDRGGINRTLSERRVLRLVRAIQTSQWRLTGEAIKLDHESKVRDGQHRLEAIARAGIPVQSVVVRNVAEDAFDVMDTGASRTPADVLGIHGIPYRMAMASAARGLILIERFARYQPSSWDAGTTVTAPEILAYVHKHPEILDAIRLSENLRQAGFIGGVGLWGTTLTLFIRRDRKATELFVEGLIEGANLPKDSPILKLRNQLLSNTAVWGRAAADREVLVALVIKGWNYWRRGEGVQQLSWRSEGRGAEDFPFPI
jgi:hypothetical protein